ncbi:hypothetical protein FI667_g9269, partial [Globisporangium splendens]
MGFPDSSDDVATRAAESLTLGGVYALEFEHEGRKSAVLLQMEQGGENQPITDILESTNDKETLESEKLLVDEAAPKQELPSSPSEQLQDVETAMMSCQETCHDYEEPMFAVCQICMDVMLVDEIVTQLCGKTCVAETCSLCLVQHLTASVYSFYPGVLPKVRCPVCLNLMNKNQWAKFVASPEPQTPAATTEATQAGETTETADSETTETAQAAETTATETAEATDNQAAPATTPPPANDDAWQFDNSHVLEKYETLCRQSCEFQSPCCHNSSYTHLPNYKTRSSDADENAQSYWRVKLPRSQALQIPTLRKRCRAFCFHREDAGVLYDFIVDTFQDNAEMIFWKMLGMIVDDERRATLLLHHLFLHPDTRTHCCDGIVCFKCKASVHHNGQCDDFVEADCVLQCRGCHVTLVKVDGCDSVRCVCGQSIQWETEVARQQQQRKQLAPASETEFLEWERWTRNFRRSAQKIRSLDATMREMRLNRLIRTHRPLLCAMVRRYRAATKQTTSPDTGIEAAHLEQQQTEQ